MINEDTDRILDAWLSGARTVLGKDNPAGPLFAGATFADGALTADSLITTEDLRDSLITTEDLRDSLITTEDLRDSLTAV
jgi:hypothetical protein